MPLLLQTDQDRCYTENGQERACTDNGPDNGSKSPQSNAPESSPEKFQDAARPKSVLFSGPRFETRGETVFDRATGALWAARADATGYPVSWAEARQAVQDMAKAHGHDAWQLPHRRLLFSLVSHQYTRPALPKGHPFHEVFAGPYWTADIVSRLPHQAWQCHVGDGRLIKANQSDAALVWAVRPPQGGGDARAPGGKSPATAHMPESGDAPLSQAPADGRFRLQGRVVRDSLTGLFWPREAGLSGPLNWRSALLAVAHLNQQGFLGLDNWRLPNIRELESLADLAAHSPALTPGHPFLNVAEGYWSSTTSVYEPRYAWAFYCRDGFVGVGFKADPAFCLLPVAG